MAAIPQICNPDNYPLDEAVRIAKNSAASKPGFELHLSQFLQAQCLSARVSQGNVFRGLEVLADIVGGENGDPNRLMTLVRPFLKSSDPQIASKAVLVLGRHSRNFGWLRNVMNETDERIRANLIESLWNRNDPAIESVYRGALEDDHPRVAANAVYGLYLMNSPDWPEALDALIAGEDPGFRRSGVWVLRQIGGAEARSRLQRLIRDSNPQVRSAAFQALKHIRDVPVQQVA
jgi:HEAT repeat protein